MIVSFLLTLFLQTSFSFELEGLKLGMSIDQANKIIKKLPSYGNSWQAGDAQDGDVIIRASKPFSNTPNVSGSIEASFCKGKLVFVEKRFINSTFDLFVELLTAREKELGEPFDTQFEIREKYPSPCIVNQNNEIHFFWNDGATLVEVSFDGSSTYIRYGIKSECYDEHGRPYLGVVSGSS